MMDIKRPSLLKPSLDTRFHIDFDWWKQHDNSWRVHLEACLCDEHQAAASSLTEDGWIDWVDPDTAEVRRIDGVQQILMDHCALQPGFFTAHGLIEDLFRCLIANGNQPLTVNELAERIGRPAETILRTLSGMTIYKGLRPVQ
jgi:hypothetical protein